MLTPVVSLFKNSTSSHQQPLHLPACGGASASYRLHQQLAYCDRLPITTFAAAQSSSNHFG